MGSEQGNGERDPIRRGTLSERIEAAYDRAQEHRAGMQLALWNMEGREQDAIERLGDEWINARNNDVRRALVGRALREDAAYQEARQSYRSNRDSYKLVLLDIERLKLLVEADYTVALRGQ